MRNHHAGSCDCKRMYYRYRLSVYRSLRSRHPRRRDPPANVLLSVPVTSSLASWYAGSSAFVLASVLVLALWGFYTSLAGQRLWKGDLLE